MGEFHSEIAMGDWSTGEVRSTTGHGPSGNVAEWAYPSRNWR